MYDFRNKAVLLRKQGKTYSEIMALIPKISKSTLSYWLSGLELSDKQKEKLAQNVNRKLVKARGVALEIAKEKRIKYLTDIENDDNYIFKSLANKRVAKIALATLYLGEGSKARRSSLSFGNSNPNIINLFLKLMRNCYDIDESKFRCTIQCRADQDISHLEKFWLRLTKIPKKQFYRTRVDPRTIGKPSLKPDYKGVCRLDYFSARIYNELLVMGRIISK